MRRFTARTAQRALPTAGQVRLCTKASARAPPAASSSVTPPASVLPCVGNPGPVPLAQDALVSPYDALPEDTKDFIKDDINFIRRRLRRFGAVAEEVAAENYCAGPVLIGACRGRQHWLQYDTTEQLFTLSWGDDAAKLEPAFQGKGYAVCGFIREGTPAAAMLDGAGTEPRHKEGPLLERLKAPVATDGGNDKESPVMRILVTAGDRIWWHKGNKNVGKADIPNMAVGAIGGGGKTALHAQLVEWCSGFNQAKKDGQDRPADSPESLWESFDRFVAPIATFGECSGTCYDITADTYVNIVHRTARRLLLSLHPATGDKYNDPRFSLVNADFVETARAIQGHIAAHDGVASEKVGVFLFIDELLKIKDDATRRRLLDALASSQQSCVCEHGLGVFPVVSSLELEPVAEEWVTASKRQMAVIHLPPLSVDQLGDRLVGLVMQWDIPAAMLEQCVKQVKVLASLSGGHPRSAEELLECMTGASYSVELPKPIEGTEWMRWMQKAHRDDLDFFDVMEAFHDNTSPAGIDSALLKVVCDRHVVQCVYAPTVNELSVEIRLIPWRALALLPRGDFWETVMQSLLTMSVADQTLLWQRTMPVLLLLAAQIKKQTVSEYLETIGVKVHPDSPLTKVRKIDDRVFARVRTMTVGSMSRPRLTTDVQNVLTKSMPRSESCGTVALIDVRDKDLMAITGQGVLVGASDGEGVGVCISTQLDLYGEGGQVDATAVTRGIAYSKKMAKLVEAHQQKCHKHTAEFVPHLLLFSTRRVATEAENTSSLTVVPKDACFRIARCFSFDTSLAQVVGSKLGGPFL